MYSGADLSALVREASLNALRSRFKKATAAADDDVETTEETEILQVSLEDFYAAMRTVLPSVSKKDRRLYDSMKVGHLSHSIQSHGNQTLTYDELLLYSSFSFLTFPLRRNFVGQGRGLNLKKWRKVATCR